jgi:hypothetical protein
MKTKIIKININQSQRRWAIKGIPRDLMRGPESMDYSSIEDEESGTSPIVTINT